MGEAPTRSLTTAHDEVQALQPMKFHAQCLIFNVGPKHEGGVAEPSPGCQDRHFAQLIMYDVMPSDDVGAISFRDTVLAHSRHAIFIFQEGCLRGRRKTRFPHWLEFA